MQSDYNIANQGFLPARVDINNVLSAIATDNSGSTAPSTTFAYQRYTDTTTGLRYKRNAANSAWLIDCSVVTDATKSGSQTFAGSSFEIVIFNTENLDEANQYNPSTGRFTCSAPGSYTLSTGVAPAPTASAVRRYISLFKNGTEYRRLADGIQTTTAGIQSLTACTGLYLASGDIIDIRLGGCLAGDILVTSPVVNYLNITRIG